VYQSGDLSGAFICIAATDDNAVNREIAKEAEERNVLLNVVDVTPLCTFIAPAVSRRGEVTLAASTGGASPALARKFREVLNGSPIESRHPVMDYADLAPILADARAEIRGKGITLLTDHWQTCITDRLLDMVQDGKYDEARVILLQDLMEGTSCDCTDGVCKMWEEKKLAASGIGAGS
jgi:siroheme synthase-like protein